MATRIKPKRGTGAPTVSDLETNEIAMDMAAGKLYVNNSGSIVVLAEKNQANDTYTDAEAIAAVEGEGTLDLTGLVQIDRDSSSLTENDLTLYKDAGSSALEGSGTKATRIPVRIAYTLESDTDGEYLVANTAGLKHHSNSKPVYEINLHSTGDDSTGDFENFYSASNGYNFLNKDTEIYATNGVFNVYEYDPGNTYAHLLKVAPNDIRLKPNGENVLEVTDAKFEVLQDNGTSQLLIENNLIELKPNDTLMVEIDDSAVVIKDELQLEGDVIGTSGNLTIINEVAGDDINIDITKTGDSSTTNAIQITDYDRIEPDDSTAYHPLVKVKGQGIQIGEVGEFSTTNNTPDNAAGDHMQNGLIIGHSIDASSPCIKMISAGQALGKNNINDLYGVTEYPGSDIAFYASNGLQTSPTALTSGKNISTFGFMAHDGSNFGGSGNLYSAVIQTKAIETATSSNARAVKTVFQYTPEGATSSTAGRQDVLKLQNNQTVISAEGEEVAKFESSAITFSQNNGTQQMVIEDDLIELRPNDADGITVQDDYCKVFASEVIFDNLPTSDPAQAGRLWNDSGTMKISAG